MMDSTVKDGTLNTDLFDAESMYGPGVVTEAGATRLSVQALGDVAQTMLENEKYESTSIGNRLGDAALDVDVAGAAMASVTPDASDDDFRKRVEAMEAKIAASAREDEEEEEMLGRRYRRRGRRGRR